MKPKVQILKTCDNCYGEAYLPDIRFHDLRHTAATLMLMNNTDILTVQRRMGHSKTSTTLDIYGHYLPGRQEEVAALMDDLVAPIPAGALQRVTAE